MHFQPLLTVLCNINQCKAAWLIAKITIDTSKFSLQENKTAGSLLESFQKTIFLWDINYYIQCYYEGEYTPWQWTIKKIYMLSKLTKNVPKAGFSYQCENTVSYRNTKREILVLPVPLLS